MTPSTITLWRPVGQGKLELIQQTGWRRFPPRLGAGIDELWIPAERLDEFNDHIVGQITLIATYRGATAD